MTNLLHLIKPPLSLLSLAVATYADAQSFPQSDPEATKQTCALYKNLFQLAEKGVMFGHQDDTLYGHLWKFEEGRSDVKEVCGDYPAVFGWELGGLETGADQSIDGVPFAQITRHACAAYARGAMNTFSWHPQNPESGGTAWDAKTTTAVKSILPEGKNHALFCQWLDRMATFFRTLTTSAGTPIPILFRPFHENTATGFWWASAQCTPDEYRELWCFTVHYLRDVQGLHNLLYVYSSDIFRDKEHYMERYPGGEWVDLLGVDAYHRQQDWDFLAGCERMLSDLQHLGKAHTKPIAFTETGLEGVLDARWWTQWLLPAISGKGLSYVLVWRNAHDKEQHFFGPWRGHISDADFKAFCRNTRQRVLFERQLPKLYR